MASPSFKTKIMTRASFSMPRPFGTRSKTPLANAIYDTRRTSNRCDAETAVFERAHTIAYYIAK
jgi:hypothetical protein